jgi:hypothetical protein
LTYSCALAVFGIGNKDIAYKIAKANQGLDDNILTSSYIRPDLHFPTYDRVWNELSNAFTGDEPDYEQLGWALHVLQDYIGHVMMGYTPWNHWFYTTFYKGTYMDPDADLQHPALMDAIRKVTIHYLWLFKVWWGIISSPNDVSYLNPYQSEDI